MTDDFDENGEYTVVLSVIGEDTDRLPITCHLARELMENPYMTIGQFLRNLTNDDLKSMCDIIEQQFEHDRADDGEIAAYYEDVVLVSLMLAQAEGLTVNGVEDVERFSNTLAVLLTAEGLKRKGFVKMHYEHISFGEEYADSIVAEKTDLLDDYLNREEDDDDDYTAN